MKQLALILLALCSSFFANAAITKSGSTLTDTSLGLKYKISGTNLEVSSYTGSSTEVTIPATVVYSGTTYTVTRIGKEAFENSGIKEVTIPATVTTIGASAFAGCDLEVIIFEGETPPVLETERPWWDLLGWYESSAFDSDDEMTVIVPEGSEDAYAGASGWSSYIAYITTDYDDTEWIGENSNDWTDKSNWTKGLPTKYKNAIIRKVGDNVTYQYKSKGSTKTRTVTVKYYPIIAGKKYGGNKTYNNSAVCRNITFEPGAGILGLHKLTYQKAAVKLSFEYDRWYAITNPMKEMYSGDLYFCGRPLTYLMKFDQEIHKESGHSYTQEWTKSYTGLQEPLVNGEGFAFKISSKCLDNTYKDGDGEVVEFPRTDDNGELITELHKFNPLNGKLLSKVYTLDKTEKAHRFAIEDENGNIPSTYTVNLSTTGDQTLIANSMMSHLNVVSFVNSNKNAIESKILITRDNTNTNVITTENEIVSAASENILIAPMQAFFVTKKAGSNYTSVTFSASDFTTDNGGTQTLRSSNSSKKGTLYVTGTINGTKSYMSFWYDENTANGFVENEDAEKVFNKNAKNEIYTIIDGKPADISQFGTLGYEAPIGISGAAGTMTLDFSGAESFENVDVLLINRQTGEEINLKDENSYTYVFDSTNAIGNLYIVFRESEQITTDAEVAQNDDTESINIYAQTGNVHVVTGSRDEITAVMIYDMTGKMLSSDSGLSTTMYEKALNGASHPVVIVKVMTTNGSKTETIMLKR